MLAPGAEPPILVRGLSKVFRVHEREEGLAPTLRSLFARRFTAIEAVRDVSFEIAEGEMVGFLGPNGAGKSTTMRILSSFMPATSGRASIAGFDVFEDSLKARRGLTVNPHFHSPKAGSARISLIRYRSKVEATYGSSETLCLVPSARLLVMTRAWFATPLAYQPAKMGNGTLITRSGAIPAEKRSTASE